MLWSAANGHCALCGGPLGEDWEADHRTPWRTTARTTVHGMQALCRHCNRRKGTMEFRKHQQELWDLFDAVESGLIPMPKTIGGHVVCGGGKMGLAAIYAHRVIERLELAETFCWVVPNGTLRQQAAESLGADDFMTRLIGHHLTANESTNAGNPTKGAKGYIVTYPALVWDGRNVHKDHFDGTPTCLILDEPHHCGVGLPYAKAIQPLVERAVCVLLLSGTIDRHDRRPVYPFRYRSNGTVDTTKTRDESWLRYSLTDGMLDHAIVDVDFLHADSAARWYQDGQEHQVEQLGTDTSAIYTALRTEYAQDLLRLCFDSWVAYRRINPRSKMLVVCADTKQADTMAKLLATWGRTDFAIATYKDDDADDNIKRFRKSDAINILVTVAKAYEGLDVPAITHLAALTHIRSRPWIEQMIARAWRYDDKGPPYRQQRAQIWVPDDDLFKACIADIEAEKEQAIAQLREDGPSRAGEREEPEPNLSRTVTPVDSLMTTKRASVLGGDSMTPAETEVFASAVSRSPTPWLSPVEAKRLFEEIECAKKGFDADQDGSRNGSVRLSTLTLRRQLEALRRQLDLEVGNAARRLATDDAEMMGEWKKQLNGRVKTKFGPRDEMSEDQLQNALRWVRQEYGG